MAGKCPPPGAGKELVDLPGRDTIVEKSYGGRGRNFIWESRRVCLLLVMLAVAAAGPGPERPRRTRAGHGASARTLTGPAEQCVE